MQTLKASKTPVQDIQIVSYPGQDPKRRQFRDGYQDAIEAMPVLSPTDVMLEYKIGISETVMKLLGIELQNESWITDKEMPPNTFERTIIGIEQPVITQYGPKEGAEIVVAHWGKGFSSPVHGHAVGYMHEAILKGKVLVNKYRLVDPSSPVVRLVRTDIIEQGIFASVYNAPNPENRYARQAMIHNFTALETTSTLHFLPEHTRDGRDNKFTVEHFEDVHGLTFKHVKPITTMEAMYLRKGDVVLVRSSNVPEYGDHYIVVTGHPIMKPHGLRVQDVAIAAPHATILDSYAENHPQLILLQLLPEIAKRFHEFHGIKMEGGEVEFPTV